MPETRIELNVCASVPKDLDSCASAPVDLKSCASVPPALEVLLSVPEDSDVRVSVPGDSDVRVSVPGDSDVCVSVPGDSDVRLSVSDDLEVPVTISSYEDSFSESDSSEDQSDFEGTTKDMLKIFAIVTSVVLICVGLYFIHANYTSTFMSVLPQELKNAMKIAIPIVGCMVLLLCYVCKIRGLCCFKSEEARNEDGERRRDIAVRVMAVM